MILLAAKGLENKEIAKRLRQDPGKVGRWRQRYASFGFRGIVKDKTRPGGKPNMQGLDLIKNAVFALLHSPPSQHNINRTSW